MSIDLLADRRHETVKVMALLARIRKARGLSQRDVADRMGTHQTSVSILERSPSPDLDLVARYAEVIGAPLSVSVEYDGSVFTHQLAG